MDIPTPPETPWAILSLRILSALALAVGLYRIFPSIGADEIKEAARKASALWLLCSAAALAISAGIAHLLWRIAYALENGKSVSRAKQEHDEQRKNLYARLQKSRAPVSADKISQAMEEDKKSFP